MKRMSLRKFVRLVRRIVETLPEEIAQYLDNVVVDVEEEPDEETLREMDFTEEEIEAGESLYGLFVPFPLPAPDNVDFLDQPHRIIIYKRPLEEDFPDPRQLRIEVRKTVIHELAHHFGFDERDLERFDDNPDPFGDDVLDEDAEAP
jgi:predicted Zn-dependent protease with MMP-like domain